MDRGEKQDKGIKSRTDVGSRKLPPEVIIKYRKTSV